MKIDIFVTASMVGSITIFLKSSNVVAGLVSKLSYFENKVTGFCFGIADFVRQPNSSKY